MESHSGLEGLPTYRKKDEDPEPVGQKYGSLNDETKERNLTATDRCIGPQIVLKLHLTIIWDLKPGKLVPHL